MYSRQASCSQSSGMRSDVPSCGGGISELAATPIDEGFATPAHATGVVDLPDDDAAAEEASRRGFALPGDALRTFTATLCPTAEEGVLEEPCPLITRKSTSFPRPGGVAVLAT